QAQQQGRNRTPDAVGQARRKTQWKQGHVGTYAAASAPARPHCPHSATSVARSRRRYGTVGGAGFSLHETPATPKGRPPTAEGSPSGSGTLSGERCRARASTTPFSSAVADRPARWPRSTWLQPG